MNNLSHIFFDDLVGRLQSTLHTELRLFDGFFDSHVEKQARSAIVVAYVAASGEQFKLALKAYSIYNAEQLTEIPSHKGHWRLKKVFFYGTDNEEFKKFYGSSGLVVTRDALKTAFTSQAHMDGLELLFRYFENERAFAHLDLQTLLPRTKILSFMNIKKMDSLGVFECQLFDMNCLSSMDFYLTTQCEETMQFLTTFFLKSTREISLKLRRSAIDRINVYDMVRSKFDRLVEEAKLPSFNGTKSFSLYCAKTSETIKAVVSADNYRIEDLRQGIVCAVEVTYVDFYCTVLFELKNVR